MEIKMINNDMKVTDNKPTDGINRNDIKPNLKPKKKFSIKTVLLALLAILIIGSGLYLVRLYVFSKNIGLKLTADDVTSLIKKDPELKKDSSGKYTTVLLVGIDSRSAKSGLKNTDSMIITSYNYETKDITMFSVPRDFYVLVPGSTTSYSKINGIYAIGENRKEGDGLNFLAKTLEGITTIDIQYYAMIDLKGFIKIVDTIGGITVNVENSFTDYQYPTESRSKPVYETVTFKKGSQKMDGKTALKYARSRKSQDWPEGTDFARARRQQRVITAIKEKVLSSDTLLNPQKILGILSAIEDNVKVSDFGTEELQAVINLGLAQREKKSPSFSFVLDPSAGNSALITSQGFNVGNLYVIGPKAGLNNYGPIKTYVKAVRKNPKLYSENPSVYVYNTGLGSGAATKVANDLKASYPYLNIVYKGNLLSGKTGTVVYSHNPNAFSHSVGIFAKELKSTEITKPAYIKTNLNGENISILLGK